MAVSSIEELETAILAYVQQNDYVSFVEVRRINMADNFSKTIEESPLVCIDNPDVPNLLVWADKQPIIEAVINLLSAEKIYLEPSDMLVYLADGKVPTLPVAKKIPKNGYKTLHWHPYVLRPGAGPSVTEKKRKERP